MGGKRRVYCPVCSARFVPDGDAGDGTRVVCPVCGQSLTARESHGDDWTGERVDMYDEREIRSRVDEFARLRGFHFNDMKDDILEGLVAKQRLFGDFYCPCRLLHSPDYQCPCRPTRSGDVESEGRCHCGLFWRDAQGSGTG